MAFYSVSSVIFYQDDGSTGLWTPSVQPNISIAYNKSYDGNIVNQAVGGETYTVQKFGGRYSWDLEWSFLTETDRTNAEALLDYTDGTLNDFQWTPNGGTNKYEVYLTQDGFSFNEVAYRAFSLKISMIQKL